MDRIMKYQKIFSEMAFKREKIEAEILSSNRNRNKHLTLCYLFPDSRNIKHWQNEIYADIFDIANMKWKSNNKYLNEKDYFNNLWIMPFENKDDYQYIDNLYYNFIIDDYDVFKSFEIVKKFLVKALLEFYIEISKHLSKGTATKKIVYSLIEKFINN